MPTYEYHCTNCLKDFEIFQDIQDFVLINTCPICKQPTAVMRFTPQNCYVKLAEGEIKTLGHLAHRHTETMSSDERASLHRKNTAYRHEGPDKPLPPGMSRVKK